MSRIVVALILSLAACAGQPQRGTAPPRVEPAMLLPPSAIGFDFQWRQRVSAHWPTGTRGFDAVLQKRGDELTLVGLSPLGLPGFVLRLRGREPIAVDNRSGQALPFEPSYVVADVQRVFFPWLPEPAPAVGERSGQVGEQHVVERYAGGQLVARSFERNTREGVERVDVTYHARGADQDAPVHAELRNRLLGYTLTIDTVEQARLPP